MDNRAFVFLDSNVLLHFRPPNEIDWCKLCGTKRVDLVIYPLLRTEISNHKDMHQKKSLRARAGERGAQLRAWLMKGDEPIRAGVFVHRESREPRELLAELRLDQQIRDDMIIAHAVARQRRGETVFVATADGGLEMKLEDQGIPVILPPDEMRLAPEPDPERQRAERAEAELKTMRNRLPAFELTVEPALVLTRQEGYGGVEEYVRRSLTAAQEGYERRQRENYGRWGPPQLDSIFNPQYRQYTDAAAEFLRAQHRWLAQVEGALWVQLIVRNTGNQTATGVRLRLAFPEEVTPFGDGGFGQPPQRPGLPTAFQDLPVVNRSDYDVQMLYSLEMSSNGQPRVNRPDRTVALAWDRIPQHDQVVSGRLWAIAGNEAFLGESAVQVSILCEEIGGARDKHLPLMVVERQPADTNVGD